ncbi:fluoride efflux transporter CrcB [Inhella gelatinilytica]|uniref:Fluoride-specific ion channel FluC n=1 Tax=Inhella gelatinilytica TaxID=2795030 RepID=A0A931NDI9_9BURK|nr:fluoride efflux transporter CrcB [Inhella gelatinilytica]MBH9552649.1 fluoride efflux transporter CrcB [Inhella gelatinilytica]
MSAPLALHTGVAGLAVFLGAGSGALLRWGLALAWNRPGAAWPWGTVAANGLGGLLIGVLLGWLAQRPEMSPLWRLALGTGFLGGLTTFSTFSAEVVNLLQQGDWAAGLGLAALHLLGSLLLTALGFVLAARWA